MASMVSSPNDTYSNLLKKMAWNWYNYALNQGATGLTPPSWNDPDLILLKKTDYYLAKLCDVFGL